MFELIFFTSSRIKMQNARHICRNYDITIRNFNEITSLANYKEPRLYNRRKLLEMSFQSALSQLKKSKLGAVKPFLIEDTSVDIHALSRKYNYEYPGLDVKYWMENANFIDIDLELDLLGNDRSVTVRSDLVLYLPEVRGEPFYFVGKTEGSFTIKEYDFESNIIYPWLDNKTFNKWFVPVNVSTVLSMLPIEKADLYDFRKKAFEEMFKVLDRYKLLKEKSKITNSLSKTGSLVDNINCHIIYGLSCSGKTTIATYLINKFDFLHIEASDFMHVIYWQHHGLGSDIAIGAFAREILKTSPFLVAEKVLEYISSFGDENIVITGFRLVEEVEFIEQNLSGKYKSKRVLVTANSQLRLNRKNQRNRPIDSINEEGLQERDERELEMGVAKLIHEKAKAVEISNESSLNDLYTNYESKLALTGQGLQTRQKHSNFEKLSLKELIILVLYVARGDAEKSEFFTTTQVTEMINNNGISKPKHVTNVGRFFKMNRSELFEIAVINKIRKYRLSNTGVGFAKLILRKFEFPH